MKRITTLLFCFSYVPTLASGFNADHTCTVRIPLPSSKYGTSLIAPSDLPRFFKDRLPNIERTYDVPESTKKDCFNAACVVCKNRVLHILFTMPLAPEDIATYATVIVTSGCYDITAKNKIGKTSLDTAMGWAICQPKEADGSANTHAVNLLETIQKKYPDNRHQVLSILTALKDETGPNSND